MRDSTDIYIRQAMKNWAADHQPPETARARLLLIAAASKHESPTSPISGSSGKSVQKTSLPPIDQAIQIYSLPWLWVSQLSLTPIRQVT